MPPFELASLIAMAAGRAGLDPALVSALVQVESGGNPWAWNPEPPYRYLWDVKRHAPFRRLTDVEKASEWPPADFPCLAGDQDQEFWGQQASWGLCEVMGAVARERGFSGLYLTELCDPVVNLTIGCAHLADLVAWAGDDVERALAAWNGGKRQNVKPPYRNAAYARKVLAAMRPKE